jgi:hypothetical protein
VQSPPTVLSTPVGSWPGARSSATSLTRRYVAIATTSTAAVAVRSRPPAAVSSNRLTSCAPAGVPGRTASGTVTSTRSPGSSRVPSGNVTRSPSPSAVTVGSTPAAAAVAGVTCTVAAPYASGS